eukprot:TRINITY_DN4773_c0_g2_i5.p2 TRINITY_DN4773_c0_g2~~TRINITY_DN4773_c0_g2_i5.p2  ORF type:complete len:224 (+),score=60.44 TRINITY_DN4773_c0_g2_i5:726-1397(+)
MEVDGDKKERHHIKPPENNAPNPTLYVRNISEKVGKEELRKSMWQMFNQFGEIVDIYCKPRVLRCKGQAWVCFKDVASSTAAMRAMQGYTFYNQNIQIEFSRSKSDYIAKLDGSFIERKKKRKADDPAKKKRTRMDKKPAHMGGTPNKILFVEHCPEDRPDVEQLLHCYFQHFPGFQEVRVVPGNTGFAFVEFVDETCAGQALSGLQDFSLEGRKLKISFAKK